MVDSIAREMDSSDAAFEAGLKDGVVMLNHCERCGRISYQAMLCSCSNEPNSSWVRSQGTGSVHAFAVFHQSYSSRFKDLPYCACIVELDEGPLVPAVLSGWQERHDRILGLRVQLSVGDAEEYQLNCAEISVSE